MTFDAGYVGLFSSFGGGSFFGKVDNVHGFIPEPASLALLTLGGLMMLRRRRCA